MDLISKHQQWMKDRGLAASYIAARGRCLRHLGAVIGCPAWRASERQLEAWRQGLEQGPDTICGHVTHVREFCKWLVANRYRRDNPALRLVVPRRIRRLPRPIDDAKLIAAMLRAPADLRLMLALIGWAGFRVSELAGLRWEAISLAEKYILIVAESAKGRRERMIALCPRLAEEIRLYGVQPSGWVFPRLDGALGPNAPYTISNRVNSYLHHEGYDDTAHSGRHRFATKLLDKSGNLRIVQEALGHQHIASTSIYTKVTLESMAAAVAKLPWSA